MNLKSLIILSNLSAKCLSFKGSENSSNILLNLQNQNDSGTYSLVFDGCFPNIWIKH